MTHPSPSRAAPPGEPDRLHLRPATAADEAFLLALYAAARETELAAAPWTAAQKRQFVQSQFAARKKFYREAFPTAELSIVVHAGAPVGTLHVHRDAAEIRVVDLALLPAHQGCGLGTRLLRRLQEEAGRTGQPLRLQVLKHERAARLYGRLGFAPTGETGLYLQMEWRATGSLSSDAIVR